MPDSHGRIAGAEGGGGGGYDAHGGGQADGEGQQQQFPDNLNRITPDLWTMQVGGWLRPKSRELLPKVEKQVT